MTSRIQSYCDRTLRLVAGVMSGTSLDGIDVAFVEISGAGIGLTMSLRSFSAVPFDEEMRGRLLSSTT